MFSQSPLPQASTASNPGHHRAENCSRPHRAERINLASIRSLRDCGPSRPPRAHGLIAWFRGLAPGAERVIEVFARAHLSTYAAVPCRATHKGGCDSCAGIPGLANRNSPVDAWSWRAWGGLSGQRVTARLARELRTRMCGLLTLTGSLIQPAHAGGRPFAVRSA